MDYKWINNLKVFEEIKHDDNSSKISIGVFPKGFGITIGNTFRRVLMSSITGFAVVGFQIPNVEHEFVVLPNINIDLQLIILNLKKLAIKVTLKSLIDEDIILELNSPKGKVYAKDIKCPIGVEIVNKDLLICETFVNDALNIKLLVRKGIGFDNSNDVKAKYVNTSFVPIEAIYSPISRINFKVQEHVTQMNVDTEILDLNITTNGTISAWDALKQASLILINIFNFFSKNVVDNNDMMAEIINVSSNYKNNSIANQFDKDFAQNLDSTIENLSIDNLNLDSRTFNILIKNKIYTISDILKCKKSGLQKIKNFGEKAYKDLLHCLKNKKINIDSLS